MNLLLEKYNDFKKLIGCKLIYYLDNGNTIEVCFKEDNFLHLLGLHKLVDIGIIQFWLDKNNFAIKNKDVIKEIKKEKLTDEVIKKSHFYSQIYDRYNSFSYENISTLAYTDVIINFNSDLVPSNLHSDYLLFEMDKNGEYNHMAIGIDEKTCERYLETFFHEKTNKYIRDQITAKVLKYQFVDSKGDIKFEDKF